MAHMHPSLARQSAKQQLIHTAERLFALHGLDGVPLRQIGTEAGTANKSAVQYHFGSKEALVEAILLNRLDYLTQRRQLLGARTVAWDVRRTVEVHQLPLIELSEDTDCYYLSFLEQLLRRDPASSPLAGLPAAHRQSQKEYHRRLGVLIGSVPQPLRDYRIHQTSLMCVHVCADRHRARLFGVPVPPFAVHVSALIDGMVAQLEAEPSAETVAALTGVTGSTALRVLP